MTDQAIEVVAAGWYDDPADASSVRWWNGVGWTEHTALKPQARLALEAAPAPATAPVVPVGGTDATTLSDEVVRAVVVDGHPLTRRQAIAAEGDRTGPAARRSQTGVAWLSALTPIVAFLLTIAAVYLYFYVLASPLVALLVLVPYLLGLLWAVLDRRRLIDRGFAAPSALWALLTPLAYLIVRRLRVPGGGPLLLFLITAVLVIAGPAIFFGSGAGGSIVLAIQVQHEAQIRLVDTGRLQSVTCPPIESRAPGSVFTCTATAPDGASTLVWVSIDSADGRFSLAPAV